MKHLALCITLLSLLVVATTPANAARHRKIIRAGAVITAVSAQSISVKSGGTVHHYKISSNTAIHVDGRKAEARDLRKGMHAQVTAGQLDPTTASAIEATSGS